MAAHVARVVEQVIRDDFTSSDGRPLAERQIAKRLGIAQPVLNQIRNQTGALGINALLKLSEYTGESVDSLLGRAKPAMTSEVEAIAKMIDDLMSALEARPSGMPGPYSRAGKQLEALRRKRWAITGTAYEQRKRGSAAQTPTKPPPKKAAG